MGTQTTKKTARKGPMPTAAIEPLRTVDDFADTLKVSKRTIYRMLATGHLPKPSLYLGKMPRWTAAAVREWLDSNARDN